MKYLLLILLFASFASAGIDGTIGLDLGAPQATIIINETEFNVNNSQYFQGYTPTTLRTWMQSFFDGIYLLLDQTGINQHIFGGTPTFEEGVYIGNASGSSTNITLTGRCYFYSGLTKVYTYCPTLGCIDDEDLGYYWAGAEDLIFYNENVSESVYWNCANYTGYYSTSTAGTQYGFYNKSVYAINGTFDGDVNITGNFEVGNTTWLQLFIESLSKWSNYFLKGEDINVQTKDITNVSYIKLNQVAGACNLTTNGTICSNATGTYIVG